MYGYFTPNLGLQGVAIILYVTVDCLNEALDVRNDAGRQLNLLSREVENRYYLRTWSGVTVTPWAAVMGVIWPHNSAEQPTPAARK